ncbi:MAG: hypothetical protein ACKPKO_08405, partial [Candidatus Fonsibacter sp.]
GLAALENQSLDVRRSREIFMDVCTTNKLIVANTLCIKDNIEILHVQKTSNTRLVPTVGTRSLRNVGYATGSQLLEEHHHQCTM